MSHQTLYRKYRPSNFDQVKGQSDLVNLFRNVLAEDKLAHAYIFYGGRGTGKTSVARIIANELKTSPEDIYEIDAASNRGIDEIRMLRDGVSTLPFSSKYKIYIIDEAHMLTIQAANALLKTLEEPPKHCIFILATTDPEKLPQTILSRCLPIEFKKATQSVLEEMVRDVATSEGYTLGDQVVIDIAKSGDGSYRDTYGQLEKVFAIFSKGEITDAQYLELQNIPTKEHIKSILEAIVKSDIESVLKTIRIIEEKGVLAATTLQYIITDIRTALLLRFDVSGSYKTELQKTLSDETVDDLKRIGLNKEYPLTADFLIKLIDTHTRINKLTFGGYMLIEASLISLLEKDNAEK